MYKNTTNYNKNNSSNNNRKVCILKYFTHDNNMNIREE